MTTRLGALSVAVLTAAAVLVLPAGPSAADHAPPPSSPPSGTGLLHGTEFYEEQGFLGHPCFAATQHVYGLRGDGTYHGRTDDGEVVYRAELSDGQPRHEGPFHIEVRNTEPFAHGPHGTHGTDTSCSPATAGTPVPAEFKICSPRELRWRGGEPEEPCLPHAHIYRIDSQGARVPCTGRGTFVREGGWDRDNWHAEWTLNEACVVVGNDAGAPGQGVAPVGTVHTHSGVHKPCGSVCVDNFNLNYVQHLPAPGLAVSAGGPSSAPVGRTVTVTAGVVDDGIPVVGAAVAFSVDGPAPSEPPGGSSATDTEGRAQFTFTAAVEGDYVVTASATSATHPGEVVTATHTVRFRFPTPMLTLSGLKRGPTEDPFDITAILVDETNPVPGDPQRDPVPGVDVRFSVTGAGQATPALATVKTDLNGEARFTFSGDRAGSYTVTASAAYLGREVTASHALKLDVKTLGRVGAVDVPEKDYLQSAVIDPAGEYAYFGTNANTGQVVKVDLATFQRVGALTLESREKIGSLIIDPAGRYAYVGTASSPSPGRVIKIDLDNFQRVGSITLAPGETDLGSAVIDPAGRYAYFAKAAASRLGLVVKVDLATFERVAVLPLPEAGSGLTPEVAVIDPSGSFAYFGVDSAGTANPPRLVKVKLDTFERVGAAVLEPGEERILSGVIDPTGRYAYLGVGARTTAPTPEEAGGGIVKVDLARLEPVGAIRLGSGIQSSSAAVMSPGGDFAYFGVATDDIEHIVRYTFISVGGVLRLVYAPPLTDGVVKLDLDAFEVAHLLHLGPAEQGLESAVIHSSGTHAYFGTSSSDGGQAPGDEVPAKVVKVALTRPPKAALVASDDAYPPTPYATPLTVGAPGVLINDRDPRVC